MATYGNDVADEVMSILQGAVSDTETATAYELSEMTGWSLYEIRLALSILQDRGHVVLTNAPDYGTPAEWRATEHNAPTITDALCGDAVIVKCLHTGHTMTGTIHTVEPVGNGRSARVHFQDGRKVLVGI